MSLPTDVRRALDALVAGATGALEAGLIGAYVVGSHALGCADEHSDVDVVVVTDGRVGDDARAALAALHEGLPDVGGGAERLDVSYADLGDLRSPMTLGRRWPHVDDGSRELVDAADDNTAHTRWVLREHALTLTGPDPRGLVAEVGADALRAEALGLARARAEAFEDDPDAWSRSSVVLTSCRILFTATHARVTGPVAAARWALDHVDATHHAVIEAAVAARTGGRSGSVDGAASRALAWDVVRLSGQAALEARESQGRS